MVSVRLKQARFFIPSFYLDTSLKRGAASLAGEGQNQEFSLQSVLIFKDKLLYLQISQQTYFMRRQTKSTGTSIFFSIILKMLFKRITMKRNEQIPLLLSRQGPSSNTHITTYSFIIIFIASSHSSVFIILKQSLTMYNRRALIT